MLQKKNAIHLPFRFVFLAFAYAFKTVSFHIKTDIMISGHSWSSRRTTPLQIFIDFKWIYGILPSVPYGKIFFLTWLIDTSLLGAFQGTFLSYNHFVERVTVWDVSGPYPQVFKKWANYKMVSNALVTLVLQALIGGGCHFPSENMCAGLNSFINKNKLL